MTVYGVVECSGRSYFISSLLFYEPFMFYSSLFFYSFRTFIVRNVFLILFTCNILFLFLFFYQFSVFSLFHLFFYSFGICTVFRIIQVLHILTLYLKIKNWNLCRYVRYVWSYTISPYLLRYIAILRSIYFSQTI